MERAGTACQRRLLRVRQRTVVPNGCSFNWLPVTKGFSVQDSFLEPFQRQSMGTKFPGKSIGADSTACAPACGEIHCGREVRHLTAVQVPMLHQAGCRCGAASGRRASLLRRGSSGQWTVARLVPGPVRLLSSWARTMLPVVWLPRLRLRLLLWVQ